MDRRTAIAGLGATGVAVGVSAAESPEKRVASALERLSELGKREGFHGPATTMNQNPLADPRAVVQSLQHIASFGQPPYDQWHGSEKWFVIDNLTYDTAKVTFNVHSMDALDVVGSLESILNDLGDRVVRVTAVHAGDIRHGADPEKPFYCGFMQVEVRV